MKVGQEVENVRQLVLQGFRGVRVVDRRYFRLDVLQGDRVRQRSSNVLNIQTFEP